VTAACAPTRSAGRIREIADQHVIEPRPLMMQPSGDAIGIKRRSEGGSAPTTPAAIQPIIRQAWQWLPELQSLASSTRKNTEETRLM
jgi:hypothetical protein